MKHGVLPERRWVHSDGDWFCCVRIFVCLLFGLVLFAEPMFGRVEGTSLERVSGSCQRDEQLEDLTDRTLSRFQCGSSLL